MGTFQGHLLPGAFFFFFAVWWTTQITKRRLVCKQKNIKFYNTASYHCLNRSCLRWSAEGIVKAIATSLGIVLEIFAAFDYGRSKTIVSMGDIQHVTMYSLFLCSGLTDILCHRRKLPFGTDYLVTALAFAGEALLFNFHLHGRSSLDKLLHILLVYVIVGCSVITVIERFLQHDYLIAYTRAYLVLLQGTWFIQAGFVLYPPLPAFKHWDGDADNSLMTAVLIFVWHAIIDLVLLISVSFISHYIYYKYCPPMRGDTDYELMTNSFNVNEILNQNSTLNAVSQMDDESESTSGNVSENEEV